MTRSIIDCCMFAATRPRRGQAGSALLVVVVLLLLASLFVLFAMNVGRFEQRTSGNDLRAKIAQEVASSGIALGAEFFNARKQIFATNDNWRLCGAAETDFPCGAVPDARRSTMYTYMAAGSGGATLADRLVPVPGVAANDTAGGFRATRQVGAVLCRARSVAAGGGGGGGTSCATDLASATSTWIVTLVSKGALPDEGSSATVSQTIGAYNIFDIGVGVPPLIASGSVSTGGGLQIVTAPNAAGSPFQGLPVSIWTRLDVDANGTPNTCELGAYLREGGSNQGPPGYFNNDPAQIAICHTCKCPLGDSLSFGKGGDLCEGPDIVDIEGTGAAYDLASYNLYDQNPPAANCPTEANLSIRREQFPADLFAYLFGQPAWRDANPGSGSPCRRDDLECNFAETRIIEPVCTFPDAVTGAQRTALNVPADTCFLLGIKNKIHIGDGVDDLAECNALGPATKGVIWVHKDPLAGLPGYAEGCDRIKRLDYLGTPRNPVALIYDGQLQQVNGLVMYGLLFVREPNASTTISAATGGSAIFGINGNAAIYGAAVVQGTIASSGGGSGAVVYNRDVLFNLINAPENINPASMPGSWTDRLRY
jgi:hypothetical protein